MNKQLVQQVTATQIRNDVPDFVTGDTVKVMVTIRENNKERQQAFEGVVISIKGAGASKTFVVRKDSAGVGVERTFFLNSPVVSSIVVLKHAKTRRKKLYFLRARSGKAARLQEILIRKDKIAANLAATKTNADKRKAAQKEIQEAKIEAKAERAAEESK